MFKGLRTKIESEQKQQGQTNQNKGPTTSAATVKQETSRTQELGGNRPPASTAIAKPSTTDAPSYPSLHNPKGDLLTKQQHQDTIDSGSHSAGHKDATTTTTSTRDSRLNSSSTTKSNDRTNRSHGSSANVTAGGGANKIVEDLEAQILNLQERLQAVIKERHTDADQSAQSSRLVATLQQDLEQERATKSELESRLLELETKLKEQQSTDLANNKRQFANNTAANNNVFIKSFNPDGHGAAGVGESGLSDDVAVLKHEIISLQAQLAKKNRQLKIGQQNLTDMKRSLQREILEHGKTQDELAKLQKQTKNELEMPAGPNGQNGTAVDTRQSDVGTNQASGDRFRENTAGSQTTGAMPEDVISFNAALGNANQFDRVSCLSRSSASVDDLDSNDLQNNHNKEVSHEYLRNVLFRYMTSTDVETTQHLVKAISVLMDFTPEQSASIKSAMNAKGLSWLRLK